MKIMLYTDNHFCEKCSIIQNMGEEFSQRLENQIKTMNWVNSLAIEKHCSLQICLGDFFDKDILNGHELTALQEIQWNTLPNYFIVGNHESSIASLKYNTTEALSSLKKDSASKIINRPEKLIVGDGNLKVEICFLPYIIERDRKTITEYFGETPVGLKRVILSHNDLVGVQMGPIVSKQGFAIPDIEANCDLFLNGHLHNGMQVSKKVYNLGNITGKDFGEDSFKYKHCAVILDTDDLSLEFIENPFAFNFYKIEIEKPTDILKLETLKSNAVVAIKCKNTLVEELKLKLAELTAKNKIINSRLIIRQEENSTIIETEDISELTMDHLSKFASWCREKIGTTELVEQELAMVCK